jgi:hypothetical protein
LRCRRAKAAPPAWPEAPAFLRVGGPPRRSVLRRIGAPGSLLFTAGFVLGFLATALLGGCGTDAGGPLTSPTPGTGGDPIDRAGTGGTTTTGGVTGEEPGSGGAAGASTDQNPALLVTADRMCAELSRAACEGAQACCSTAVAGASALATCVSQQTAKCRADLQSIAGDRRAGYDPAVAAQSVAMFRMLASTCDPSLVEWASERNGLLAMFSGTVAAGGACMPTDLDDGAAVMSCQTPGICHVVGVGQMKMSGTCGALLGPSAPCVIDTECDPQQQLRCDFNSPVSGGVTSPASEKTLGLHGHCVPRLADGSKCARATECASVGCESKVCVARTIDRVYCVTP